MNEKLKEIKKFIEENPDYHAVLLGIIADKYNQYLEWCEKQNNTLLREALGDAVHLLGMKRRPNNRDMKEYCVRIEKAIFPQGINNNFHHEGEKRFYKRFLE